MALLVLKRLKSIWAIAWITIFVLSTVVGNSLYAGEKDSGGGNTIQFQGHARPILLDRLMLNPGLAVNPPESKNIHLSAREYANLRLEAWLNESSKKYQVTNFLFVSALRSSLLNMPITEVPFRFKTINRYYLPDDILKLNPKIETSILYLKKYGVFVSKPSWSELDVETQAGLLIHEAIRQFQFLYGLNDLTDLNLQFLTAVIMDSSAQTDADLSKYFSSSMHQRFLYFGSPLGSEHLRVMKSSLELPFEGINSNLEFIQNGNHKAIVKDNLIQELLADYIK